MSCWGLGRWVVAFDIAARSHRILSEHHPDVDRGEHDVDDVPILADEALVAAGADALLPTG